MHVTVPSTKNPMSENIANRVLLESTIRNKNRQMLILVSIKVINVWIQSPQPMAAK